MSDAVNTTKKILLIDDDEIHLAITENMLKDEYEIITANSGKKALGYLIKGLAPSLILLDIMMPGMDGWETYHNIKGISLLNNAPIAFFTSAQEDSDVKNAREVGAADYIIKPLVKEELLKRIKAIIG